MMSMLYHVKVHIAFGFSGKMCYNVRKGQRKSDKNTDGVLAQTDVFLEV